MTDDPPTAGLTPAQHLTLLHPKDRGQRITLASASDGRWSQRALSHPQAIAEAEAHAGATDVFVSQHGYRGRRSVETLHVLGACAIDCDSHKLARWAGHQPGTVADAVLTAVDDAALPAPSFVLATGRGLLVTWLLEPVPPQALPRWTAVQRALAETLQPVGADRMALDAARVCRLAGTRNGKSGRLVELLWPPAPDAIRRWPFDELAGNVLARARPASPAPANDNAAPAAATGRPATRLTARSYWQAVERDLHRLRALRWPHGIPSGERDPWMFWMGVALGWLLPPTDLEERLIDLGQRHAGWSERETRNRLSAVLKRARQAAEGVRLTVDGRDRDPRYHARAATIREQLAITADEQRIADLRVLVDDDRRRELKAERTRDSRRRHGVRDRAEVAAARKARADTAAELRANGLSVGRIAAQLGVSECTVRRDLRHAGTLPPGHRRGGE